MASRQPKNLRMLHGVVNLEILADNKRTIFGLGRSE
jgi:hypothetical protein